MRPFLFRFTIRRSMAVVAILGIVMAVGMTAQRLRRLRADYQIRAEHHANEEQNVQAMLVFLAKQKDDFGKNPKYRRWTRNSRRKLKALMKSDPEVREAMNRNDEGLQAGMKFFKEAKRELEEVEKTARVKLAYHADLKRKYQRAADHPWESVSPDAKEPGSNLVEMMQLAMEKVARMGTD